MTLGDWFYLLVGLPFLMWATWWSTHQVWRKGRDFTGGPSFLSGRSPAAMASIQLPVALSITCAGLAAVSDVALGGSVWSRTSVGMVFYAAALFSFSGAVWMWLLAWPRVLVPPAYRGRPGWLLTTWQRLRRRGNSSEAASI